MCYRYLAIRRSASKVLGHAKTLRITPYTQNWGRLPKIGVRLCLRLLTPTSVQRPLGCAVFGSSCFSFRSAAQYGVTLRLRYSTDISFLRNLICLEGTLVLLFLMTCRGISTCFLDSALVSFHTSSNFSLFTPSLCALPKNNLEWSASITES